MLAAFLKLLLKWNRVYNLTAVRDPVDMIWRHLVDSLILCRWLPDKANKAALQHDVVDIGSGAGLPVLPLAIVRSDLQFVSVESNGKKTRFQQQVLVELGLRNVQIINQRVQNVDLKSPFVTSRAFTAPADFLNIARPLCAENAVVAIMLAQTAMLPEALPAPFSLQEIVPVHIPDTLALRHIALCRCLA